MSAVLQCECESMSISQQLFNVRSKAASVVCATESNVKLTKNIKKEKKTTAPKKNSKKRNYIRFFQLKHC